MTTPNGFVVWTSRLVVASLAPGSDENECPELQVDSQPEIEVSLTVRPGSRVEEGDLVTHLMVENAMARYVSSQVLAVYLLSNGQLRLDGIYSHWAVGTRVKVHAVVKDEATGTVIGEVFEEFTITKVPMTYCMRLDPQCAVVLGQRVVVHSAVIKV